MMKKSIFYILFCVLLMQSMGVHAQLDSINLLDEVVLSDVRLFKNSIGQQVQVLDDSIIRQNEPSLTSVLKFNSPLYFKENGPGMVSSPSFRGTTAAQTAVVWNGININSQLNGQTDFNTILASSYDQIAVRAGGGSVLYGSGAIGGSIHLNNRLRFNRGLENEILLKYGSFETLLANYSLKYSTKKTSLHAEAVNYRSDNDFEYPDSDKFNQNGDFNNLGLNFSAAHILNDKNTLHFYTAYYDGERGFSGTTTARSNKKYMDKNSRNLLEWNAYYGKWKSVLRTAYLDETYRYYENRYEDEYVYGRAKTGIAKWDLTYLLGNGMNLSSIAHYELTEGEGSSILEHKRNSGSVGILFAHDLERLNYEVAVRTEYSDRYKSPVLWSLSSGYRFSDSYQLKLNLSRNYRIPTFNDLFWYAGGNQDLVPEESLQLEVGQELDIKDVRFSATVYVLEVSNLLRWVPSATGLWQPENTEEVRNYGLELLGGWEKQFENSSLNLSGTYAYTRSRDQKLDKELIYVPIHKATASGGFSYGRLSSFYQYLYNGSVFTSSDNNYELEDYSIHNVGLTYSFGRKKAFLVGVELRNLFNEAYESLPSRPMPGRSINSSITVKF